MRRCSLVFLLLFYQFGSIVGDGQTCWASVPQILSIVTSSDVKFNEFLVQSLADIKVIRNDNSLTAAQKTDAVTKILIKKRTEVVEIKWKIIREMEAVFKPFEGEIFANGLKKILGLSKSPTLYPFRCFVKEAKGVAIKAYETYQRVAQHGIHVNKHL
jgi:hypothetical protein